jgi:uncharacterized protein (TIGR02266 family)
VVYERSILILDSPLCELGETSLGLISLGLRPLYATDFEELVLLARERREQVGALLAPAALVVERLEAIRKRLLEPLGLPAECILPASKHPGEAQLQQLALAGVRWAAVDPISPRDLRFLVALALSVTDVHEMRKSPRSPCELPVTVQTPSRSMQARIIEISAGGAYLAMRAPLPPETRIRLAISLASGPIELTARVAWRTAIDGGGAVWLESGMGVEFLEIAAADRERLQAFCAKQLHRYAIAAFVPSFSREP